MIKAVVFDGDGMVIVDEAFSKRLEKEYGIPVGTTDRFFHDEYEKCRVGKADLKVELKKCMGKWGWKGSPGELIDFWFKGNRFDERFAPLVRALQAKGVKCYLATNQEKYRGEYLMKQLGLGKVFDGVFLSSQLHCKKPEPEFFGKMLDLMNVEKAEVLLWDDRPNYVDKAKAYGFNAELYENFHAFHEKVNFLFKLW